MEFFNYISVHGLEIIHVILAVLSALIAIFMLVPGKQPEKSLRAIADFIEKFSKK